MQPQLMPAIKWSGSKRSQAKRIIELFPDFNKFYEPFLGGGSVLIEASPKTAICGDVCEPLINFWNIVKNDPKRLIRNYTKQWNELQIKGYITYYKFRNRFNKNPNAIDLLFLSRTCVNGLIRFNSHGQFNNSFHHTRKGINPDTLKYIIMQYSNKIKYYKFSAKDYEATTKTATCDDLIYLDPPYFNTNGRYYGKINFDRFFKYLKLLNNKKIPFILSFDGSRGNTKYFVDLPKYLFKRHIILDSGNSSFKKVMSKKTENVKESLYLNF